MKNIPMNNNFLVNAKNSIDSIIDILKANNLKIYKCWKSKSNSIYLDLEEINPSANVDYRYGFIIRFSDHYCWNYSKDLIMNLVNDTGQFMIGASMIYMLKRNIKDIINKYHSNP